VAPPASRSRFGLRDSRWSNPAVSNLRQHGRLHRRALHRAGQVSDFERHSPTSRCPGRGWGSGHAATKPGSDGSIPRQKKGQTLERSERVLDVASLYQTPCRGRVLLIRVRSALAGRGYPAAGVVGVWGPPAFSVRDCLAAFYGGGDPPWSEIAMRASSSSHALRRAGHRRLAPPTTADLPRRDQPAANREPGTP